MGDKLVGVIIPRTGKEGDIVRRSIEAIENSTFAKGYHFNIEIITLNVGQERSMQRNEGMKQSKADYFLILDADQVVSENVIGECFYLMERNSWCDGIYIPEIIPGKSLFNRIRNFERQFYTATPVDVVRFVRKGCPLFDETLNGPEDSDWDRRVGPYHYKLTCKSHLSHYDNIGLRDYIKKKAYYSQSMKRYAELHPTDKVLDLKYRCFGIFVEGGKWKKVVGHPVLFLGIVFILLIRGIIWITK